MPKPSQTTQLSYLASRDDPTVLFGPTGSKLMEPRQDLKDTEGYDWLESTELAIDKRKFLLNRLFVKQTVPED